MNSPAEDTHHNRQIPLAETQPGTTRGWNDDKSDPWARVSGATIPPGWEA